jgi:hypothetical protein
MKTPIQTSPKPAPQVGESKPQRVRKLTAPAPVIEPTIELENSEVDQAAQPDPPKAETQLTSAKTPRVTKTDAVIAMLRRPDGATLDQIIEATGWQRHSARGALAGAIKKKLGAAVVSEVFEGGRRYRAPQAPA